MGRVDADRAEGTLLGLACGDALGRPVEFESPARILAQYGRVTEMIGDGTWGKSPGTVTDDTDMALCLARSLVERGRFDPADVARRFLGWFHDGPFDVGNTTAGALKRLERGERWDEAGRNEWERSPEGTNAGNGSVMRSPPLAVAFATDTASLRRASVDASWITHADPRCTAGSAVLNAVVAAYLRGDAADDGDGPVADALDTVADVPEELHSALAPVPGGIDPDALETSGYVVHTLQTALYHALAADTAEEALVEAVNMGGDADTVGAVTGAVAGARFGASALPERWLDELDCAGELRELGCDLAETTFSSYSDGESA